MTVRRDITQSRCEMGARSCMVGCEPGWEFRMGDVSFVGIFPGAGLPGGVGKADFRAEPISGGSHVTQYVDRASGEPARRQAYRSGISTVAGEAVMNHAG